MLDTATKKRIDDCRNILVGKLPDPKAQIEQITIGLIYKFMDDMDKEAIELGGKVKFFADYKVPNPEFPGDRKKDMLVEFSKYRWDHLFDAKVTATEMLGLYSEAIAGMDKNPNIPSLFRDIFKNAFLPYRDPETLKMFLKTIGEFEYTHSEKLGDAFEYLLSVMGSQGDAGQFRTPRHIIDFVTAIVNPGKTDKILDPACGTAGFLISAFKHICAGGNTRSNHGHGGHGRDITPDERKKIIQNFVGYDISPDMVRLSLVNLYLHGFSDPHIWEYDTLSSEERWDETFDVILANPPFMSPKGGIRPHKKFSISSNRSEVLFIDYIAEHLNPKGRAGIIVPEGVIFQSGTAYKDLRKMLVENYLYAVVSLPSGVFNPYSGVKTSVLLMDKEFAKKSNEILFVKIDNDGYGLGAQRNEVKGGQLEEAVEIIHDFMNGVVNGGGKVGDIVGDIVGGAVGGNIGGAVGNNVGGKDGGDIGDNIGDNVGDIVGGNDGDIIGDNIGDNVGDIVGGNIGGNVGGNGGGNGGYVVETGHALSLRNPMAPKSNIAHVVSKKEIAKNGDYNLSGERYKIADTINSIFELKKLSDICTVNAGGTPSRDEAKYWGGNIPWVGSGVCKNSNVTESEEFITEEGLKNSSAKIFKKGTTLIALVGATIGKTGYLTFESCTNQNVAGLYPLNDSILNERYLFLAIQNLYPQFLNLGEGKFRMANLSFVRSLQIPLPPLSIQQEIVTEIEGYQKIIDGAKSVVENYKPTIDIDADWEMVALGEVCRIKGGNAFKSDDYVDAGVQLIRMGNVKQFFFDVENAPTYLPKYFVKANPNYLLTKGDLIISMTGTVGKEDYGNVCQINTDDKFLLNQRVGKFEILSAKLNKQFLYYVANTDNFRKQLFANSSGGVRQSNISNKGIESILIPFPSIEIQHQIVSQIEKEQALVNANKLLIKIFEQKIKDRIAKVWGAEKTAEEYKMNDVVSLVAEG